MAEREYVAAMDLARATATELLAGLRARHVSSVELLDAYLARVDALNPRVNAVVTLDAERARARAAEADAATARGDSWGPLHGLPVSVKDALDTAGVRTTGGSKDYADRIPVRDAPVVARIKDAGAVVFAKTNLPLWSGDIQTWNELFGATANPWDLDRAPGGSSGGSAVAMACGLSALELGTDIGGSVRNPAHFTGVYAHKPTYGIVPGTGYFDRPDGGLVDVDINVIGPIARSVDDLELALGVIAGPDTFGGPRPWLGLPPARSANLAGYRIAVWFDDPLMVVDGEVKAVLRSAVASLVAAGATVEEARPDFDVEAALRTYFVLLGAAVGGNDELLERGRALRGTPIPAGERVNRALLRGVAAEVAEWDEARRAREVVRRAWAAFHQRYDVVLCPVAATAALPTEPGVPATRRMMPIDGVDRPAVENMLWCALIGLAMLPSTVVPAGATAAGLPVGVQVVGPYYEDATALDAARRIDAVLGAFRVPPLALDA
jgi:amidase